MMTDTQATRSRTHHSMNHLRSIVLAVGCSVLSSAALVAQAGADAASRAVAAAERAQDGRTIARRTVAVLPFVVTSPDTALSVLGYGLAEFLSDDLAHSHRLVMVERFRLADLQRESNFSLTAKVDPETRVLAGRLLAAQHLIFGTIDAPEAGAISIDERAVNVETGDVELHRTTSTSIDAIFRAERDLAMDTFSMFGITLTPDERRALYERVAPEFRAFVAFSHGVRAEQQGDDATAIASFQDAAALDKTFKLASSKLAAARQRISTHAPTALSSGAAPSGTLSASGTVKAGVASPTASTKKTDPSPSRKKTARTVHGSVKPT